MLNKYKTAGSYSNLWNKVEQKFNQSDLQSPQEPGRVFYQNYMNSNIPKGPWNASGAWNSSSWKDESSIFKSWWSTHFNKTKVECLSHRDHWSKYAL